jgi:uncharacterized protein
MVPYRILSLDGGGIRGALTIRLIERLEAMVPGWVDKIDLLAGTSTGGIIALGLAGGMQPTALREIYQTLGAQVFADTIWDNIKDLGKLIGADYSTEPLHRLFIEILGDITLGDLQKRVLISTFNLDDKIDAPDKPRAWKAKFFHNYPGTDSDAAWRVADVGVMTSAAPTYFPIYMGHVDGGVVANNPSVCALAQALCEEGGDQPIGNVRLLSLGTGRNPKYIARENADWGLLQWAPHLVELMLDGGTNLAHFQCRQILRSRYRRLDPYLQRPVAMDNVKELDHLLNIANLENLDQTADWIRQNIMDDTPTLAPVPDMKVGEPLATD